MLINATLTNQQKNFNYIEKKGGMLNAKKKESLDYNYY